MGILARCLGMGLYTVLYYIVEIRALDSEHCSIVLLGFFPSFLWKPNVAKIHILRGLAYLESWGGKTYIKNALQDTKVRSA